ncbi:uncharacterized protein [Nicotiana sylvestris]|uniref:uncharacterized protein n=1 Tax=Nicotiana sylvestris TaxID=4096 RepID=UPI00388C80A5
MARKPKANTVAISLEMAQCLRDQEEEDDDFLLVARKRESIGASKSAKLVVADAVHSRTKDISEGSSSKVPEPSGSKRAPRLGIQLEEEEEIRDLRAELAKALQEQIELTEKGELVEQLREELKMKEAETLKWRQGMDSLASEKDTLREQLASLKRQLQSMKEDSLARGCKVEELKAKSTAELAKAKSDAEAIISSYRANAEVANARAKEIFAMAEVKLSCAVDHARRQSRKETLEEGEDFGRRGCHFAFYEDDSASGSESGGYEDEVPEEEASEDATPEDVAPEDAATEDMAPK